MSAPNGASPPPPGQQPPPPSPVRQTPTMERARQIRAELEAKFRQTIKRYEEIEPMVDEQVRRVSGDYRVPLWASVRLKPEKVMLHTKAAVAAFAMWTKLDDDEARGVAQSYRKALETRESMTVTAVLIGAAFAWRGRHAMRFPLFTPRWEPGGFWDSTGMSAPKAALIHAARFSAYYIVTGSVIYPFADQVCEQRFAQCIKEDPRLARLGTLEHGAFVELTRTKDFIMIHEIKKRRRAQQMSGASEDYGPDGGGSEEAADPWPDKSNSIASQAQSAWKGQYPTQQSQETTRTPPSSSSTSPPQDTPRDEPWDGFMDQDDDASPVASSQRNNQGDTRGQAAGGSAWERIRRQNSAAGNQTQRPSNSWQSRREGPGSSDSGNNGNAGSTPNESGDSYPSSSEDRRWDADKNEAQREFDALLERERRGFEQEEGRKKR